MILRLRCDAARLALASASVHAVVTSPPYFGLRRYPGVSATVWDGDASCAHDWGAMERGARKDDLPTDVSDAGRLGTHVAQDRAQNDGGRFCRGCGAWRGTLGNEPTVDLYIAHIVACFREIKRVLRDDGCAWVILGDSFSSAKSSALAQDVNTPEAGNLLLVPCRVALALQADGWLLRSDVIWAKPNPMPESVNGWRWEQQRLRVSPCSAPNSGGVRGVNTEDGWTAATHPETRAPAEWRDCGGCERCSPNDGLVLRRGSWRPTRAHEYALLLAKSELYYADADAVREPHAEASLARYEYGLRVRRDPAAIGSTARRRYEGIGQADRLGDHVVAEGRNKRSVWTVATQPYGGAHFAAFPEALIEPMILASTPAAGVCSACGAPRARVVERRRTFDGQPADIGAFRSDDRAEPYAGNGAGHRRVGVQARSLGWRPTCGCGAPPALALVLDPFAGSGTVGRVAVRHRRRAILCDLSAAYLRDLAGERTTDVQAELPLR